MMVMPVIRFCEDTYLRVVDSVVRRLTEALGPFESFQASASDFKAKPTVLYPDLFFKVLRKVFVPLREAGQYFIFVLLNG